MTCVQMNESAILGTKLSVQVARCVSWRIARCYDPDALFKVCLRPSDMFPGTHRLLWRSTPLPPSKSRTPLFRLPGLMPACSGFAL